ncbi:TauD/TfdA family dioxygenase [Aspergillus candidus]|uniref:Clavaminate synthase-like protein n=1 Tax=Aspergillus candidus TaxID=41067 RepID=A0A2I2FGN6_ASPCN|nr:Clavaminate synthase-like protein [Aspergillus candidus]PLB39760.1 Clavaminate synthase-like protein [Aspergillus candidus]
MAPGLVEPPTGAAATANKSAFPDGLKTSGQHAPDYTLVKPYAAFPKEITGPTVWQADDYRDSPERWTYSFNERDIDEISTAADRFIHAGTPLTGITKDQFPLPGLSGRMEDLRKDLIDGKGFFLFRNLPVQDWDLHKAAVAYMGLGTYLGYFVSQNGRGHVLGRVKDLGEDPTRTDKVRIYRTNARQYFHTDGADLVGLLCIAKSQSGGESDIVSTHHILNILQRTHPDVVETLATPNWYFDRKGEVSAGQEPWIRGSVIYLENRTDGQEPRVYARFDPNNVTSLGRFNSGPDARIPPLSVKQKYAMEVLETMCKAHALHMILAPGDIQFLSNSHVFHARTAYEDYPPGAVDEAGRPCRRRHLMRLWLAVPQGEGGWRLPYPDCGEAKRGGIQVDEQPPACPFDAE